MIDLIVLTYLFYIGISIAITLWVGQSLHKNGRIFLVESFQHNENMADSVNHLLLVGFYLINAGFILLALKYGAKPATLQHAVEFLSTKIGIAIVVLGIMHFFNMYVIAKIGKFDVFGPAKEKQCEAGYIN